MLKGKSQLEDRFFVGIIVPWSFQQPFSLKGRSDPALVVSDLSDVFFQL